MMALYLDKIKRRISSWSRKLEYGLEPIREKELSDPEFSGLIDIPSCSQGDPDYKEKLLDYYRKRKFFYSKDTAAGIKEISHIDRDTIIKKADEICDHVFTVLNKGPFLFGKEIDWSGDFEGKTWKTGYYKILNSILYLNDFNNKNYIGDVKIPWEFNKHLHFYTLAMAYTLTDDEKYTEEFISEIRQWAAQNPYLHNLAWTQPLIVSQRLISWIMSMRFFLRSVRVTPEFFFEFMKLVYYHILFIHNHYEVSEKASNHLFGDLAGSILGALVFPEFRESSHISEKAFSILEKELAKQVYPDGVDYEQSVSYQRYVIEFLYVIFFACSMTGIESPGALKKVLENMLEYLMHIVTPDGEANLIGDADGAYVYKFDLLDINDYRPHLAIGGWILKRGDLMHVSGKKLEALIWLAGVSAFKEAGSMSQKEPARSSLSFPMGGYSIMSTGWGSQAVQLIFDHGNIGMGYTDGGLHGTHGHDDTLSIILYAFGKKLLIDPGSGAYTGNKTVHDYMRSSLAHNTVSLARSPAGAFESHSVLGPHWCLSQRAESHDACFLSDAKGVDFSRASCSAYKRFGIEHFFTRNIFFMKDPGYFLIADKFDFEGTYRFLYPFHLAPGGNIETLSKTGFIYKNDDVGLYVHFAAPGPQDEPQAYNGNSNPYRGWFARDYGLIINSPVLEYSGVISSPADGTMVLCPFKGMACSKFNVTVQQDAIEVSYGNRKDVFRFLGANMHECLIAINRFEGEIEKDAIRFGK